MPLRHLTANRGQYWSELSGCVDVGTPARYHLARVHINLRPGHEAADLERVLTVLVKHRQALAAKFTPKDLTMDELLGTETAGDRPARGTKCRR